MAQPDQHMADAFGQALKRSSSDTARLFGPSRSGCIHLDRDGQVTRPCTNQEVNSNANSGISTFPGRPTSPLLRQIEAPV